MKTIILHHTHKVTPYTHFRKLCRLMGWNYQTLSNDKQVPKLNRPVVISGDLVERVEVLFLALLLSVTLYSCEKVTEYTGTYTGTITYNDSVTTPATRIIQDGYIHWWDAPNTDCYTTISGNSYQISNVIMTFTPTCNGVTTIHQMIFNGIGTLSGDSLTESGTVELLREGIKYSEWKFKVKTILNSSK